MMTNPLWFKDAVIYQLHVKTFQDSDGDGVGDFGGLLQRLDYLAELGVTALWLMPFYPSPLRDDGYDIADYLTVNSSYGTLEQFEEFVAAAHARGLRVITELVLNHTSDQHPWFQRARRSPPGSRERDYYVWSDTADRYREARVIFQDFEPSNWTWDHVAGAYFWHRFYSHQPDLNFDNPAVQEELLKVVDFWLSRGVDGVRLDAVPYLYERDGTNCENLAETHAFLQKLRTHIDTHFPNRMILAEANQWPEDAAAYFGTGNECHMNFHFPLMPRLFMSLQMEDRFPIMDILEQTPAIPANCQWAIFLRNHDELTLEMVTDEERDYMVRVYASDPRARINLGIRRRLAPLLGNNRRKIELMNSLLLSLPGTPIIYYGDEIGMGDNIFLGDRNGVRTPMQWSPDRNSGFSAANPQRLLLPLIIDPEYHYETVNAENQQRNASSLFWWMRRTLAVRKNCEAFTRGEIEFLQPENAKVLAYLRRGEGQTVLVVANLSRFAQVVELDLRAHAGAVPVELFGMTDFPAIRADAPMVITLGPHGFYWFALRPEEAAQRSCEVLPTMAPFVTWNSAAKDTLTKIILPCYFPNCAWFRTSGRIVRDFQLTQLSELMPAVWLALVEVTFQEGQPETYLLPLAQMEDTAEATFPAEAILARIEGGQLLIDALFLPQVRAFWLQMHRETKANLRTVPRAFATIDPLVLDRVATSSRIVELNRSNTSISYDDTLLLKVYRRFDPGTQPEVDLLDALQRRGFPLVPVLHSAVEMSAREGRATISALTAYVAHQGDGWTFTLDALSRFFDRALESRLDPAAANAEEVIGAVFSERMRSLGKSMAALHRTLAGESGAAFAAEPFGTLHQRSLYQAMRGQAGRVLRLLRREAARFNEGERALALRIVEERPAMLRIFSALLNRRFPTSKTRVHGDLHLGQLLNTGKEFVFIDFEGEASRPQGERSLKRCPLVDVASMLRSLDYAAAAAMRRELESDREFLRPWARLWVERMANTLAVTYFAAVQGTSFLSADMEEYQTLLKLYVLSRALHELGHELAHHSEFIDVPLDAVARMISEAG